MYAILALLGGRTGMLCSLFYEGTFAGFCRKKTTSGKVARYLIATQPYPSAFLAERIDSFLF